MLFSAKPLVESSNALQIDGRGNIQPLRWDFFKCIYQSGGARNTRNLKAMNDSDKVCEISRKNSHLMTFCKPQAGL